MSSRKAAVKPAPKIVSVHHDPIKSTTEAQKTGHSPVKERKPKSNKINRGTRTEK
jgi:hypothetical protein